MMVEIKNIVIGSIISVLLILAGISIEWVITKDESILKRDGEILAKHKFHVESQRTYINKNTWYRRSVMCPRIIEQGGRETATRCYYPQDYYEQLSRSLINTKVLNEENNVIRKTPYYAYGTRGSYAGILEEIFKFMQTKSELDFPDEYTIAWEPRDTRYYKLVWRVWSLKDFELPDGDYHLCNYYAKNVKIELGTDCALLEKAEVKGDRIWFYFYPGKGNQLLNLSLVDPSELGYESPAKDTDKDGMSDDWEEEHGLDPTDPSDADKDPDFDGYSNRDEYEADSDPNDPLDIPQPEEQYPPGYIGAGGTSVEWTITKTGDEEDLDIEYEILDDTSTEFCVKHNDKQKYSNALSSKGRSLDNVPISKLNGDMTLDASIDITNDNCFVATYDSLEEGMNFKIGWESVLISSTADNLATYSTGNENIVKDSNGYLHVAYEGDNDDPYYANSTDDGETWTAKQIQGTSVITVGIVINSTDDWTVYWEHTTTGNILGTHKGLPFGNSFTIADATGALNGPSCAIDNDDIIHCCMIDVSDELLYINSTAWDSETIVNDNNADDSDACDIEITDDDCVYIVASGSDEDDIDIWSPCLNGWGDGNRVEVYPSGSATTPTIATNGTRLYISFFESNDLWFSNSSDGGATWDSTEIDNLQSGYPDIEVNGDDIYIVYNNGSAVGTSYLAYANSSDGGISWDARNMRNWSWFASIQGSRHPVSNRISDNMLRYVTFQVDGVYYDNFSIATEGVEDVTSPVISSVTNGTVTNQSAIITWTTDEPSNSSVNYGTVLALGTLEELDDAVTSHSVTLTGLINGTLHYYNVTSCDTSGNCATDDDPETNFTTLTIASNQVYISDCAILDSNGSTYLLTDNIINSADGTCMDIIGTNITLDCQGYAIDGIDSLTTYGIKIYKDNEEWTNVSIKNCNVTDWERAIYLRNAHNNTISDSYASECTNITYYSVTKAGIYLSGSDYNHISNVTMINNYNGLYLNSADHNTISNVNIMYSTYYGIFVFNTANHNTISNSRAVDSFHYDLFASPSSSTYCDNTFTNFNGTNDLPFYYANYTINITNENVSGISLCDADNSRIVNVSMNVQVGEEYTKHRNSIYIELSDGVVIDNLNSTTTYIGVEFDDSSDGIVKNSYFYNHQYETISLDGDSDGIIVNNTKFYYNMQGIGPYPNYVFKIESTSTDYKIYNNYFYNGNASSEIAYVFNYTGGLPTGDWNTSNTSGTRIYSNGSYIGGNYYTNVSGNGYSDTCTDSNTDGFCDVPYNLTSRTAAVGAGSNIDYLPLSDEYIDEPPTITYSGGTPDDDSTTTNDFFYINVTSDEALAECWAELSPTTKERTLEIGPSTDNTNKDYELYNDSALCGGVDTEHPRVGTWDLTANCTSRSVFIMNLTSINESNITAADFYWRNEQADPCASSINNSLLNISFYYNASINNLTSTTCANDITSCRAWTIESNGDFMKKFTTNGLCWYDTYGDWLSFNITQQIEDSTDDFLLFYALGDPKIPLAYNQLVTIGDSEGADWRVKINYTLNKDNTTMTTSGTNSNYNNSGLSIGKYTFKVFCNDTSGNIGNESIRSVTLITGEDVTAPVISNVRNGTVSNTTAEILWTTDEVSNSTVEYWNTLYNETDTYFCYQENATDDTSNCGSAVGSYAIYSNHAHSTHKWSCDGVLSTNMLKSYDTNYSSFCGSRGDGSEVALFVNYSKPSGSNSAQLQIRIGNTAVENVTLTDDCFEYYSNKISLGIFTTDAAGGDVRCYNGSSDYLLVKSYAGAAGINIYEEAIFWNLSMPYNITYTNETDDSVTSHQIGLVDLTDDTQYWYNVTSCDTSSNCAENGTSTFTTLQNATPPAPSNYTENLFYIVVDDSVYNTTVNISDKLDTYISDIESEGYNSSIWVCDSCNYSDIRNELSGMLPQGLVGAIFIGEIPFALWEVVSNYQNMTTDYYYMDLNGSWEDNCQYINATQLNCTAGASNGVFDNHTGDIYPDIFIGRLRPANATNITELNNYFDKVHNYRIDNLTKNVTPNSALIYADDPFVNIAFERMKLAMSFLAYDITSINDTELTNASDFVNVRLPYGYEIITTISHGANYQGIALTDSQSTRGVYYFNFTKADSPTLSYYLGGCTICNYISGLSQYGDDDNLCPGVVFSTTSNAVVMLGHSGLNSASFNNTYYFTPLGQNFTYGEAYKSQMEYDRLPETATNWYYAYNALLIGDPLLKPFNGTGVAEDAPGDITAPTFSDAINDSTNFRRYENFTANITISDAIALSTAIFSTNVSGIWLNNSDTLQSGISFRFNNSANISLAQSNTICWRVHANDSSDNMGVSSDYCFDVVNTVPIFNESLSTQSVTTPASLDYDVNCSDIDDDTITYSDNTSLFNINSGTGVISDTPDQTEAGVYIINITCSDAGSISETFQYTISDGEAPAISAVTNSTVTNSTGIITWTTDESSNSSVNYGTTLALGTYEELDDAETSHSITLTGLINSTLYYYNVTSCDTSSNCATDDEPETNITTLGNPPPAGDTTAPGYDNLANNASSPETGVIVNWSVDLVDETALDWYVFAHNQTGTLTNQTFTDISGTSASVDETVTITASVGANICGQFWFNDTSNNINVTSLSCIDIVDITSPVITNIAESSITNQSATISWTTNEASNTSVNWGADLALGNFSATDDSTTSHSRGLTGLQNLTLYYYNVTSCDTSGNCATSNDTFTTLLTTDTSLLLDGLDSDRFYEYETTANITYTNSRLTIYDFTGRYVNITTNPLNYLINLLRLELPNQNISSGQSYNVSIDNRTDLYSAKFNISGSDGGSLCYQETASEIEDCGAVYSDEIALTGNFNPSYQSSNAIDADYDTNSQSVEDDDAFLYINYTKPLGTVNESSFWQAKPTTAAGAGTGNITINSTCWKYPNKLVLQVHMHADSLLGSDSIKYYCHNTSDWVLLESFGGRGFYEEAMQWNLSSGAYPSDTRINYSNNLLDFPGLLINNDLYQRRFIFDGKTTTKQNISFLAAGTKEFSIDYSSQGNSTDRVGYFNFTLTASSLDGDNEFDYNEKFQSGTNLTDVTKIGTAHPIGSNDGLSDTFEAFCNNRTDDRWQGGNFYENSCNIADGGSGTGNGKTIYSDYIDLSTVNRISFKSNQNCHCVCSNTLEFTDLTSNVNIKTIIQSSCPSHPIVTSAISNCNYNMTKAGTVWTVTSSPIAPSVAADCYSGTVNVASLNSPYYVRLRNGGGCLDCSTPWTWGHSFDSFNIGGVYLNKTNSTFTGIEGSNSSVITGNFTTHRINTTLTNVSRVAIDSTDFTPSGTSISYYLSNNDGIIWELAIIGETHRFISAGNQVRAKFVLSTTSNITTPIVYDYGVVVVSSPLEGLGIDVGSDNSVEVLFDFVLNETSTPVHFIANDSSINSYIDQFCQDTVNCSIPISLIAESGGDIEISAVNLTENINPVSLNTSPLQDLSLIELIPSYTQGQLFFSDPKFDYRGNRSIVVSTHEADGSSQTNLTIKVLYSQFNITINPPGIDFWNIGPNIYTWVQNNIPPFGNENGDGNPFFNASKNVWDHERDIYIRYNESVNSCATTWFTGQNMTDSSSMDVVLNTTGQMLVSNLADTPFSINTYTNISCAEENSTLIIPIFCAWSKCSECVFTSDMDDNCDWYG